ncbi:MAG: bifunctional oligoribonuclease/PAP phosphatase NrnA [Candidatus Heimdallarchaeota archaeon]
MRNIPSVDRFIAFVKQFQGTVGLKLHPQADLDAVGAAIAITQLIKALNPNLHVQVVEDDISKLGRELLDLTGHLFDTIPFDQLTAPLLFIYLDTNQVDNQMNPNDKSIAVIDHHIQTDAIKTVDFDFRLETFRATTEIVAGMFHRSGISLTKEVRQALLAGLIFDTRRFLYGDDALFQCVSYVLDGHPEIYPEVGMLLLDQRMPPEKIACIKAAQRAKRWQINETILLVSHVSSFEAAAARALVNLGSHVAIVIAQRKTETRISIRTAPTFPQDSGISIGRDVIPPLIKEFGGSGGGHSGAAGYNHPESLDITQIKAFVYQLFEKLLGNPLSGG